ncbi:MAG: DUF86 domain-containing protein [Clostridia bacterium]|nr:DUF86 domain-containing protein [Clostridia bacterium]
MQKVAFVREQVVAVSALLASRRKEEILGDPWLVRGLKYALQTAVEAVIDVCYHVCARHYAYPPTDARDALRALRQRGLISEEELRLYAAMVGFRNKLVHGYEEVSPERVYDVAAHRLGDFESFIRSILVLLEKKPQD